VNYVGINPPLVDELFGPDYVSPSLEGTAEGEKASVMRQGVQLTLGQWAKDPHGVSEEVASKRQERNWWKVDQRLFFSDEERARSGVKTILFEDGSEALTDEGIAPLRAK
jgi:hypothetical protein